MLYGYPQAYLHLDLYQLVEEHVELVIADQLRDAGLDVGLALLEVVGPFVDLLYYRSKSHFRRL
jgi:hypothetical protein